MEKIFKIWKETKERHEEWVVLVRTEEFYETCCEDAVTLANIFGHIVTDTEEGEKYVFLKHSLDRYLSHIIRRGYKVAIVEGE